MKSERIDPWRPCVICGKPHNRHHLAKYCGDCMTSGARNNYEPAGIQNAAIYIVSYAIKHGILPKIDEKTKCVDCGKQAAIYEHRDYMKPLDVEPVCHKCNSKRGTSKGYKGNIINLRG